MVNDAQGWSVVALVAGLLVTLFLEIRGDRKELRASLEALRVEIGTLRDGIRAELNGLRGELSEVKVTVGRTDERLKGLEVRLEGR